MITNKKEKLCNLFLRCLISGQDLSELDHPALSLHQIRRPLRIQALNYLGGILS